MKLINNETRRALVISIIIGTVGGLTAIGMFSLSGLMISKSAFKVPLYTLMVLVATIKLFGFIRAVARYLERLISHEATFTMLKDIRVETFDRLINDFVGLHSRWQLSTLLERTVNDIEKLQNILLRVIYPPVVTFLTTVIVCIIYSFYSFEAVLVIIAAMMTILFVLPLIFSRYLERLTNSTQIHRSEFMKRLTDYQLGQEDIAVFDPQGRYMKIMERSRMNYEHSVAIEKRTLVLYDFLLNVISMLAIWGVLYVMADNDNVMMYASVIMVTITLFEFAIPMTNFPFYHQETKKAMNHINALASVDHKGGRMPHHILPLKLHDLTFRYPDQERPTLQHISLHVDAGEKIGIIGGSGSGKTTLINLITGLYDSNLTAAGVPITELDRDAYFQQLNVMQQHNHFFQGTIQENLFSDDRETIEHYLDYFKLPYTTDSEINEFGAQLSGGERRRLHFIRLLMRTRDLWLLDEPFNGVDVLSKETMLDQLLKLDAAVVVISHEVELLKDFDRIYIMNEGRIVCSGTYEELQRDNDYFVRFMAQEESII